MPNSGPSGVTSGAISLPWAQRRTTADYRDRTVRIIATRYINPSPLQSWHYTHSTQLIRQLVEDRMYPLTPEGLGAAMRWLAK